MSAIFYVKDAVITTDINAVALIEAFQVGDTEETAICLKNASWNTVVINMDIVQSVDNSISGATLKNVS